MKAAIIRPDEADEYFTPECCHILEMSNSRADEALSIARARVEPGVTTRLHRLAGTTERYVVLSGTGRVEVGDLPATNVKCGDIVLIPPEIDQRITNTGDEDLFFLALCTPRFLQESYKDTHLED
ncbi:MAG: cupin domain-containing protein [Gammaproteobacteria bacterium]|nr:cupin domain-containing protein [Gammaproteobacteria bacterium]MBT8445309.1 cupin domain-containing protein [Gammaproteobacteria bacterium]NND36614.1 cupin domain-containing protein [Gammaproteobacteria bacterium]